jgi:hypothetical protein
LVGAASLAEKRIEQSGAAALENPRCTAKGTATTNQTINIRSRIIKKSILIASALATVGVAGLTGVGVVAAQGQTTDQHSNLVSKLAQQFNLKEGDVQKVFDDNRATHQARHEQRFKTRLDQAVKDGKITQDQANKLLAKLKELADFKASLQGKTPQQHRDAMKAKHAEQQQWLADNNIPKELWHFGQPGRGHMKGSAQPANN